MAAKMLDVVKVTWVDSCVESKWIDHEEYKAWANANHDVTTVGIMLEKNKDWLIVVMSVGEGAVADVMKIPIVSVKKIIKIGKVESNDF